MTDHGTDEVLATEPIVDWPGASSAFFLMWTRPRATVRQVLQHDPRHLVLLLASVGGIGQVLDRASFQNLGDVLPVSGILVLAVLLGPILGIIGLYLGAALVAWTGKWIGGRAPSLHIRTALAWGSAPTVFAHMLWIPCLALFGSDLFTAHMPRVEASILLALLMTAYGVAVMVLGIWTVVVAIQAVAEVQGFSAWRGLGNIMLAFGVVLAAIIAVGTLAAVLIPRL